jgi:hypothetical protein
MIDAYVTEYIPCWVAGISTMGAWGVGIFEDTTSQVVNDQGDELWTCNIAFNIPIRYNQEVEQDIVQRGLQYPT